MGKDLQILCTCDTVSVASRKLTVELGDNIVFVCQINNTERDGDHYENILMFSSSEHLSNCNFTGNNGDMSPLYSAACVSDGFDWTLAVVDRGLSTEPAFVAGQRYYFTSELTSCVV